MNIITTNRKSFIIHNDSLDILDQLTDQQAGKLFKAISCYQKTGQISQDDQLVKIAIVPFINQFKRDEEKYLNIVERNKINISKRWSKNTTGKTGIPKDTKNTDSDSDSDSDSKNKKDKRKRFTPPTLQDIQNYCKERKNSVSASKFFDYYSAGEWKDKDGKAVKNWKQKLLSWEGRDTTTGSTATPKDSFAESINQQIGQDLVASVTEKPDHVQVLLHSATACDKWMKIPQATRDKIAQQVRAKFSKEPKLKF